jgi:hypothetical protein
VCQTCDHFNFNELKIVNRKINDDNTLLLKEERQKLMVSHQKYRATTKREQIGFLFILTTKKIFVFF